MTLVFVTQTERKRNRKGTGMTTEVKHKKSEHEKAIRTKERVRPTEEEQKRGQETLRCKRRESQRNGVWSV